MYTDWAGSITLPSATSPRGFGRRLLRSSLLEALAYPHGVDRYVEILRPLQVKREVRAEVTAVDHQTPKSVTLALCPNENWRGLHAGQFVGVSVEIDGVRETRPYSPAGSQQAAAGSLELTVSTHPEGRVSRYLRDHARPGMIVGLTQAEGDFRLPDPRPERLLLISGGSGITPVMAMLRTVCEEGFAGEIGFLNYTRSSELALYGAELDQLADRHRTLRVARGFTRGGGRQLNGRFRREHLRTVISDHASAATFVCGPPALIDAVRTVWAKDRLAEPAVETFTPPALSFDTDSAKGIVSFASSGREAANSGLPLLEQAEDAGLAPEHGCRMGICNTCSCRKRTGTVRNVITGELSTAREEQIRICVSVPVGDVALDL
ncbi:MAG TPA: ferredoxin reductase [Solirubrobacteraceae bacterium]|nr:ferredoxin reductase [Solirubrobacteraceae bacterium]